MKKRFLVIVTVFLSLAFSSCTENEILPEEMLIEVETQGCCGTGELDPPPPPPPPPGGGSGG